MGSCFELTAGSPGRHKAIHKARILGEETAHQRFTESFLSKSIFSVMELICSCVLLLETHSLQLTMSHQRG